MRGDSSDRTIAAANATPARVTHADDLLTVAEAAVDLGVTDRRVQAMITGTPKAKATLPATKFGRDWMIRRGDLELVRHRAAGRPSKIAKGSKRA